MKARYLKGAGMRAHWMKDRMQQGEFDVYWEPAISMLAGYHTKCHSPRHHRAVRPIFTHIEGQSPAAIQGCANILLKEQEAKQARKRESPKQVNPHKPARLAACGSSEPRKHARPATGKARVPATIKPLDKLKSRI